MRVWVYIEPGEGGLPMYHFISDRGILATRYRRWCEMMVRAGERFAELTEANCIADFVVIHWAADVAEHFKRETVH